MFIVLIRTIILYSLVILVMRLMGKRQIGELQPYEFVITIMISDLAALPMQDTRLPLILGIIPIVTLLFVKTILTQLQLKSQTARKILEGEPCILICKGKINYDSLKKQQINLDELMEELRLAGYFNFNEVEYAILENNGQLSFLTSQANSNNTIQPTGCEGKKPYAGKAKVSNSSNTDTSSNHSSLPIIYVLDGHVNYNSLTTSGQTKTWIEHELKKHNIESLEEVLIAMTDTNGKFIYQLYDEYDPRCKK